MSQTDIRIAQVDEYGALAALYIRWGYGGGIRHTDVVYLAERNGRSLGLVRRAVEHGIVMLRGMYVDPAFHRQGIGRQLLHALVADLGPAACFCIPLAHLISFYEGGAFALIPEDTAAPFLIERMQRYRREGHRVVVMRRTAQLDIPHRGGPHA